ncbi:CASP-like protein 4A2 [Schistocerca piceifrons]|uniref:CASP-like protein 4A2 n=1 Tax=Schistocerca piceifrons TaxID=274613 RepID=UPI001F5E6429|nr:CASP-like protein 4A2 [Schistocerca piceifrons]
MAAASAAGVLTRTQRSAAPGHASPGAPGDATPRRQNTAADASRQVAASPALHCRQHSAPICREQTERSGGRTTPALGLPPPYVHTAEGGGIPRRKKDGVYRSGRSGRPGSQSGRSQSPSHPYPPPAPKAPMGSAAVKGPSPAVSERRLRSRSPGPGLSAATVGHPPASAVRRSAASVG